MIYDHVLNYFTLLKFCVINIYIQVCFFFHNNCPPIYRMHSPGLVCPLPYNTEFNLSNISALIISFVNFPFCVASKYGRFPIPAIRPTMFQELHRIHSVLLWHRKWVSHSNYIKTICLALMNGPLALAFHECPLTMFTLSNNTQSLFIIFACCYGTLNSWCMQKCRIDPTPYIWHVCNSLTIW